jgi:hypothetical protein
VLGGLVVLAAPRARRRNLVLPPRGLAAFESAPCFDNGTGASEAAVSPRES